MDCIPQCGPRAEKTCSGSQFFLFLVWASVGCLDACWRYERCLCLSLSQVSNQYTFGAVSSCAQSSTAAMIYTRVSVMYPWGWIGFCTVTCGMRYSLGRSETLWRRWTVQTAMRMDAMAAGSRFTSSYSWPVYLHGPHLQQTMCLSFRSFIPLLNREAQLIEVVLLSWQKAFTVAQAWVLVGGGESRVTSVGVGAALLLLCTLTCSASARNAIGKQLWIWHHL